MKWYKHQTDSHNDEGLAEVLHEFGLEGYGFWWLLQEIVGKSMDASDRCDLSYPLATWARRLQCSKRKTSTFFQKLSEISLIILDFDDGNEKTSVGKLKISIPNLLKSRDEYSKKSGQSTDKLPKVSGAKIEIKKEIQIEIKKEPKPKPVFALLPLCEAWKSYLAMRVKIKKPITDKAMVMAVSKLSELQSSGNDPVAVLNQSTFNSWQGLFEVKGAQNGKQGTFGNAEKAGRKAGIVEANKPDSDWLGGM